MPEIGRDEYETAAADTGMCLYNLACLLLEHSSEVRHRGATGCCLLVVQLLQGASNKKGPRNARAPETLAVVRAAKWPLSRAG